MLLPQFIIGTLLIVTTVVIHAFLMDKLIRLLDKAVPFLSRIFRHLWKVPILIMAVLGVFGGLVMYIWAWALIYLGLGALHDFEASLYFSTVTFSTVGFGDIVLDRNWRLLSAFQAANGFILFGWSTAFIFEIISKIYQRDLFSKIGRPRP